MLQTFLEVLVDNIDLILKILFSFLAVAEELKIKGLTQSPSSTESKSQVKNTKISNTTNTSKTSNSKSISKPRVEKEEEIQEIPNIKTEPTAGSLIHYQDPEEEGEGDYQDYQDYQEVEYEENSLTHHSSLTTEFQQGKPAGEI